MNRRNFFSKLGSAVVGCYLALGVEKSPKVNPEWIDAEYEIAFAWSAKDQDMYQKLPYYLCKVQLDNSSDKFAKIWEKVFPQCP